MKLGLDISGGDFAPRANVLGAILALEKLPDDVEIVLIGREDDITSILKEKGVVSNRLSVVNAPDVITIEDHPTRAVRQNPDSAVSVGFDVLAQKEIDSFARTGSSGAMF